MKDFEDVCKSHKACAIALLPAITTIDYEEASFKSKIEILEEVDKQAGIKSSPVHYAWVNATCHVSYLTILNIILTLLVSWLQTEIFSYFDVDPTALPTVVYLHTSHNKYGAMIGKFDRESIEDHEEKFKSGKLSVQDMKVDKRDLKFTEIDCPAQMLAEVSDDDDDFDEILAEILAEEKARKEAEEEELGGSSKKSSGKKKKKSKKKKGKKGGVENDELWIR